MLRIILIYGSALALGAIGLDWVEYRYLIRTHPADAWVAVLALGFLALGIWVGFRLFHRANPPSSEMNSLAQASLGISERELEVLGLLAAGQSNKEIAKQLSVSPNTVKTHVAKLFDKLAVKRRTEAIARARELGIIR